MARKGKNGVNVSAAIREYLKANTDIGPTEAAKAISQQIGKKITPTYVSNIKALMNSSPKKKGRKGRKPGSKSARAAVRTRSSANGTVEVATIVAVKELLKSIGANQAHQLIDLLA